MKSKSATGSNQSTGPEVAQAEKARTQNAPSPAEIQQRVYEIHIERGCAHGQDVDDWLQAERELEARYRTG
jgi:hypothetical protein